MNYLLELLALEVIYFVTKKVITGKVILYHSVYIIGQRENMTSLLITLF